ncbi:hypothetical protein [Sphingomonas rubra]|uniref:hypothetical protein n=1 Tax=Sphingomonas rubra TaxID=634430 RepID=UPI000AF96A48|nr:hypothetical protein [Sphingomonas rubra]
MSELTIWATYAVAILPAYLLRRFWNMSLAVCLIAGASIAVIIWTIGSLLSGANMSDPWLGIGAFIAAGFGGMFALAGAGAAIWFE